MTLNEQIAHLLFGHKITLSPVGLLGVCIAWRWLTDQTQAWFAAKRRKRIEAHR